MSVHRPVPPPVASGMAAPTANKVTAVVQSSTTNFATQSKTYLDHFLPPEKREQWRQTITKLAAERPYLAGFLLSQLAICGVPLLVMTIMAFAFALLAGCLMGALGAFVFITGAMGFALLILLPILLLSSGTAVLVWLWGVGAYLIYSWFQRKDISGPQKELQAGLVKATAAINAPAQSAPSQVSAQNRPLQAPPPAQRPSPSTTPQPAPQQAAPQAQRPPVNTAPQQPAPTSLTAAPVARSQSPNSQVPPRKPVSRPSSPAPPPDVSENKSEVTRKPVPSRSPSPSPEAKGDGGDPQAPRPVSQAPINGTLSTTNGVSNADPQQPRIMSQPQLNGSAPGPAPINQVQGIPQQPRPVPQSQPAGPGPAPGTVSQNPTPPQQQRFPQLQPNAPPSAPGPMNPNQVAPLQPRPMTRPLPPGAAPTAMRAASGPSPMNQEAQGNGPPQAQGQIQPLRPLPRPAPPMQTPSQPSLAAMVAEGLSEQAGGSY